MVQEISGAEIDPLYHWSGIARVYEGQLDDERLKALIVIGMPQNEDRVRFVVSGSDIPRKKADGYIIEFFGIKAYSPPNLDEIDCSISYVFEGEGTEKHAHIWLWRVRWKETRAVYEETWMAGQGWAAAIRDLHLVEDKHRQEVCKILLKGAPLGLLAQRAMKGGRLRGSGRWKSADELEGAVLKVLGELRRRGRSISQETVAQYFSSHNDFPNCSDGRQLRRWLDGFKLDWADLIEKSKFL